MVDNDGHPNIVHWGSNGYRRVVSSVLGAEVHGMVLVQLSKELLGTWITVEAYSDSKTLFNVIVKEGATIERCLQIYIFALRKSYEQGAFTKFGWIPGPTNIADAPTKDSTNGNSSLWKLMNSNRMDIQPLGWAQTAT